MRQDTTAGGESRRRDVLRTLGAGAVAVGLAGCSGVTGGGGGADADPTDEPTDAGTDTATATPAPTPDPNCEVPVEVSGAITSDTTWNCRQYLLTGDVSVRSGATLTVGPGVEVVAQQSVRLSVEDDAILSVEGMQGAPVVVRGEQATPGFWDGIEFATGSAASKLTYAQVSDGGNSGWANVYVQNGSAVSLEHSTFRDCSTYGVIAESNTSFPEFTANAFDGNTKGSVSLPGNSLGDIDAASTYAGGSGSGRIGVVRETVTEDATWPATDAPIHFFADGSIAAAVTVEPGARFTFAQATRLSAESGGSLTAVGEEGNRISFAGETAVTGFWDGIEFVSNSSDNRLEYVDVAHGGNGGWANVYVQNGAQVSLRNSNFSDASTYGVYAENATSFGEFAANSFSGNENGVMRIPATLLGSVDGASAYAGGAGPDRVAVARATVETDATWPALDVPYYCEADIPVAAAVTVDPGARFTFAQSTRLSVESGGSLKAVGGDDRISFTGATEVEGFWDGIEFASLSPDNVLDNCEVAHGGNGGWANVYVQSTGMATVRNSLLRDSSTYAIYAESSGRLTETGNQFSGNASGDVNQA